MINYLKKISTLNNLSVKSTSGQIATLLILMIVGLLIFILVTVNIGQVSVVNTNVANAADSAVLSLASQLSARANMTYHNLGGMKKCKKTGGLGAVLAIVCAVIIAIVTWGAATPYVIAACAAAGAVGGAVGNVAVQGSCTWGTVGTGALQGAIIGAAIGCGATTAFGGAGTSASSVAPGAAPGAVTETVAVDAAGNLVVNTGAISSVGGVTTLNVATGTGLMQSIAITAPSAIGAAAGVTLAAGSNLYNTSVSEQAVTNALSEAHKAVNGLMDYDRFRESVFLQALTQVVDDPEKVIDNGGIKGEYNEDLDGDGETTDETLRFYQWWDGRVKGLKVIVPILKGIIEGYFNGPFTNFRNFCEQQYTQQCQTYSNNDDSGSSILCTFGPLCRQELEGEDGAIIKVLRDLDAAGQGIKDEQGNKIWEPGPNKQDIARQGNCNCGQGNEEGDEDEEADDSCCPPLPGIDRIDDIIGDMHDFVETLDGLKSKGSNGLALTYQSWKDWFYDENLHPGGVVIEQQIQGDEEVDTDFYLQFDKIYKELKALGQAIETKRDSLPDCVYQDDAAINCPCKDYSNGKFATSNSDLNDEFEDALNAIEQLKNAVDGFKGQIKEFVDVIEAAYKDFKDKYGGVNPATYHWDDSRGAHYVSVETGLYKVPYVKKKKSGNWLKGKTCFSLTNYSDDGSTTWVRITRRDPANKDSGIAGLWNAYVNRDPYAKIDSAPAGMFSMTKIASAYWSFDSSGGRLGLTKKK